MDILLLVGEITLIVGGVVLYRYIRAIPDTIHKRSLKEYEHRLSAELETLRAELREELEILRISREQIQIHKVQQFTELASWFNEYMLDSNKLRQAAKKESERKKLAKKLVDLGTRLFFFASDDAVKKYIEWREITQKANTEEVDPLLTVVMYGELMTEMRRDVGYQDTDCNASDYLKSVLTNISEEEDILSLAESRARDESSSD